MAHLSPCMVISWVGGSLINKAPRISFIQPSAEAGEWEATQESLSLHLAANSWDWIKSSSWRRCGVSCGVSWARGQEEEGGAEWAKLCFLDDLFDWGFLMPGRGSCSLQYNFDTLLLLLLRLLLMAALTLVLPWWLPGLDPGGEISQDGNRTKCA